MGKNVLWYKYWKRKLTVAAVRVLLYTQTTIAKTETVLHCDETEMRYNVAVLELYDIVLSFCS